MTNEELKIKLTELLPTATFEEGGEWINMNITPPEWKLFAQRLRSTPGLDFDFFILFDMC